MDIKRIRLSIPYDDIDVMEWVNNQQNLSQSVRLLIKDFVRENGLKDAMCVSVLPEGDVRPVRTQAKKPRTTTPKKVVEKPSDYPLGETIVLDEALKPVLYKAKPTDANNESSKDDMQDLDFDSFMGESSDSKVDNQDDINELLRMI